MQSSKCLKLDDGKNLYLIFCLFVFKTSLGANIVKLDLDAVLIRSENGTCITTCEMLSTQHTIIHTRQFHSPTKNTRVFFVGQILEAFRCLFIHRQLKGYARRITQTVPSHCLGELFPFVFLGGLFLGDLFRLLRFLHEDNHYVDIASLSQKPHTPAISRMHRAVSLHSSCQIHVQSHNRQRTAPPTAGRAVPIANQILAQLDLIATQILAGAWLNSFAQYS